MRLTLLAHALQVVTAFLAVMLARRTREHKPIAVFLCSNACADLIAWVLSASIPPHPPEGPPLSGLARVAADIDCALFLIWPAALAGTALWVFLQRRAWVVIHVWAAAVAALVLTYPTIRGVELQKWYLAAELAALAVTIGAFIQWAWRREPPRLHLAIFNALDPWMKVITYRTARDHLERCRTR
jgi:hypothetical protein